jgi:hypothetical protein
MQQQQQQPAAVVSATHSTTPAKQHASHALGHWLWHGK